MSEVVDSSRLSEVGETSAVEAVDPADTPLLLEVTGLARSFGETRALVDASLEIRPGEVHALAGENGSGKSTMIKILSGVLPPEAGEIRWNGAAVRLPNPRSSQAAGISTVFQDTLVAADLSVQDNLVLGTNGLVRRGRTRRQERESACAALAELGFADLDLGMPLRLLSLAEQQIVTVARAIARPWRLLILDEATSALDADMREGLFAYLRRTTTLGRSVLFTSHRMDEVQQLADRVSVLRLGETVATLPMAGASPRAVLTLMAGRNSSIGQLVAEDERPPSTRVSRIAAVRAEAVLRAEDLVVRPGGTPLTIDVHRGEILGVAGLEGHGQAEFSDCLCGLRKPEGGRVLATGESGLEHVRSFVDADRRGIAYVPRDRKREGLFHSLSIFDNFAMALLPRANRFGVVRRSVLERSFREHAALLHLKSGPSGDGVTTLSGGNQQKVLLGRWLATGPKVLVLNDPLRGVDGNTKEELYQLFLTLAAEGLSIVLLSSEILELLTVCDRIAVFYDGGLQTILKAERTTETDVVSAMFGRGEDDDG